MFDRFAEFITKKRSLGRRVGLSIAAIALLGGLWFVATPSGRAVGQDVKQALSGRTRQASAFLRIRATQPEILPGRKVSDDFERFVATQIALIKSQVVLDQALKDPKLKDVKLGGFDVAKERDDAVEWLKAAIRVELHAGSEILSVSLAMPNVPGLKPASPSTAADVVNAVVRTYLDSEVGSEVKARVDRLDRLRKLYSQYQEEIKARRNSIRRLTQLGLGDIADELRHRLSAADLEENRKDLYRLGSEKNATEFRLKRRKAEKKDGPEIAELEEHVATLAHQIDYQRQMREAYLDLFRKTIRGDNDLKDEQQDIDIAQETAGKIGAEIEKLEIELQAPRRIVVLSLAH